MLVKIVKRKAETSILSALNKKKAVIIMGARQVGKTSLLHKLFDNNKNILWLNGDDIAVQDLLENVNTSKWKTIIGNNKTLIIDEAQHIENIGIKLKLITDNIKNVRLIATGSSSFDLANKINEPLTGRKREINLFPFSFGEMVEHTNYPQEHSTLEHRLIFGYYPEVVSNIGEEREVLKEIINSYLYKDILKWERIKKPDKIIKLLQVLAFQVGSLVSYSELASLCGIDSKTVEQYIILLEQSYIIFRLSAFRRNLGNELKNSRKIYFWDNGVRNALISNFNSVDLRNDVGALWENFLICERIKHNHYKDRWVNNWFWRTQEQKEIDYIEETDGKISAFEFKWSVKNASAKSANAKYKIPTQFLEAYPNGSVKVISRSNYSEFIY